MSAIFDSFSKFGGTIDQTGKAGEAQKVKNQGRAGMLKPRNSVLWKHLPR